MLIVSEMSCVPFSFSAGQSPNDVDSNVRDVQTISRLLTGRLPMAIGESLGRSVVRGAQLRTLLAGSGTRVIVLVEVATIPDSIDYFSSLIEMQIDTLPSDIYSLVN